jgi:hypothetical protein
VQNLGSKPCFGHGRALVQFFSIEDGKFGDPRRRGTDVLMAINIAVFVAQLLTKQRLLTWGAKVHCPSCISHCTLPGGLRGQLTAKLMIAMAIQQYDPFWLPCPQQLRFT